MSYDPWAWLNEELAELEAGHLHRFLSVRQTPQAGEQILWQDQSLLNFGSNDYLGLANDPRLQAAAELAMEKSGYGTGASPLVTGRGIWHARLEQAIAAFEGAEAALLFPTGYAANMSTISALAGQGDLICSDAKNHASIIDGCRLSRATVRIYAHGDVDSLREQLASGSFRRRLIVTDSLFSMDGDFAPLTQIAAVAEHYEAMLLVDEAHATGVMGVHGRGVCEFAGLENNSVVRIGTLSKALGSHGGFVVGSQKLIDFLVNKARAYIFSTAAPEASAAAALAALEIVQHEPERRIALLQLAEQFRLLLQQEGFQTGQSCSQIIPVILGDAELTMQAAAQLRTHGCFVPGIRPPTVPAGESLLRISLTWRHTEQHLEQLLSALKKSIRR